jgi:hypothetical protein
MIDSYWIKEFYVLDEIIKKKDKVIKAMAEMIHLNDYDRTICEEIKCNKEPGEHCIECVIEYFERKVKE